MKYEPKTGSNAGKRNRDMIEKYLKNNPESTGIEIAEALGLSLPTIYGHLKDIRTEHQFADYTKQSNI